MVRKYVMMNVYMMLWTTQLSIDCRTHYPPSNTQSFMISKEFSICVVGIYLCFLTWGLTQERVTTTPYNTKKFKHFIFLNLIQSLIASFVAYIYLKIRSKKLEIYSGSLIKNYIWLAISGTIAPLFGYASLQHIDYPTVILGIELFTYKWWWNIPGKSCKLVPVVVMNFLIYKRTFKPYKYIVVAVITLGVSLFTLLSSNDYNKEHKGKLK